VTRSGKLQKKWELAQSTDVRKGGTRNWKKPDVDGTERGYYDAVALPRPWDSTGEQRKLRILLFIYFFDDTRGLNSKPQLARQALYHLSHSASLRYNLNTIKFIHLMCSLMQ
jgi:hypothetical protein